MTDEVRSSTVRKNCLLCRQKMRASVVAEGCVSELEMSASEEDMISLETLYLRLAVASMDRLWTIQDGRLLS